MNEVMHLKLECECGEVYIAAIGTDGKDTKVVCPKCQASEIISEEIINRMIIQKTDEFIKKNLK